MEKPAFDIDAFFFRYRYYICLFLLGVILIGLGVFASRKGLTKAPEVVLEADREVMVEIAGEVVKPAVYKFASGARVEDLLVMAGGLSVNADRDWVNKNLNRAAKLTDGQKIFIPSQTNVLSAKNEGDDQTVSPGIDNQKSNLININTSSLSELDTLHGIGPVYAQKIIDHRPYSTNEELVSKQVLSQSVYNKIKDKISVY